MERSTIFRKVWLSQKYSLFILHSPRPLRSTLFPYTTLFRSSMLEKIRRARCLFQPIRLQKSLYDSRSEEHTSELQSRRDLVCRLLLEKKNGGEFKFRRCVCVEDRFGKYNTLYARCLLVGSSC